MQTTFAPANFDTGCLLISVCSSNSTTPGGSWVQAIASPLPDPTALRRTSQLWIQRRAACSLPFQPAYGPPCPAETTGQPLLGGCLSRWLRLHQVGSARGDETQPVLSGSKAVAGLPMNCPSWLQA